MQPNGVPQTTPLARKGGGTIQVWRCPYRGWWAVDHLSESGDSGAILSTHATRETARRVAWQAAVEMGARYAWHL
jgi:hypothetical protein